MIMRETVACKLPRRTLLAIAAVALLLLPGFTLGQDKTKPTTPDADTKKADETKPGRGLALADFDGDGRIELLWQDELYDLQVQFVQDDQKLSDLEARVRALLKEVQALKGKPAEQPEMQRQIEMGLRYLKRMQDEKDGAQYRSATQRAVLALAQARTAKSPPNEVTLLRVTYLLPAGKAAVFAGLLKEHVKATPLETNVDGDKLVVTTTPDFQRVIHAVVDLLQERQK